jgi:O-acetyl-ADP-ribose deacetylase (regulator of RNase III)
LFKCVNVPNMITHRIGNLLKQLDLDAWIHQANCFNTMGSGIAKEVKETYPEVYEADCRTIKGDIGKLGTFSFAKTTDGKIGYNLYSQFNYGRDGKLYTNYEAMRHGLEKIREHVKINLKPNSKVGIPCRIGCVRGGGDWNEVLKIINEVFEKESIEIVICEFKEYSQQEEEFKNKLRISYRKSDLLGLTEENKNEN